MAVQNLVSASITPETQDGILKTIADIRSELGFLLNLPTRDQASMVKAGKELTPFLDECHRVVHDHPEILSGVFDVEEFNRDWQLATNLAVVSDAIEQLAQALSHTLTAARSDTLVSSLAVYAAVKLHRDKVPGLNVTADKLGVFFKRPSHPASKAIQ